MADDLLASRYAQAAFEAAKDAGEIEPALQQLTRLGGLLGDHAELRELFFNPDVDPQDKLGVLERLVKPSDLVRAFLQVVVTRGRAEALPAIMTAFQARVDEDQGRLQVAVRSARPLSKAVLERVGRVLKRREGKAIVVTSSVEPQLVGGLEIQLGYRIADSSVRRQLAELRERLSAVKVA